ncbi:MAG TPA: hypothetical protein VI076_09100 [Actinopolymorphaceae bacterium]
MPESKIPRDDAEAALAARRELGHEFEPAIVDSFVDRLETVIEERVAAEVQRRVGSPELQKLRQKAQSEHSSQSLALGIVSMALAIPLTAIVGGMAGPGGIVLVWVSIVLINLSFNFANRRR